MRMTYLPDLSTFPHWRPVRQEPDALDFNADHDAVFDEPTLSLAHIMDIAGIFHALDNIEKRILSQLVSF